jgi:hypothetical protein
VTGSIERLEITEEIRLRRSMQRGFTLMLQKSRMLQMQGVKGEAVVSLYNAADAVSWAFPKGKQQGELTWFLNLTGWGFYERHFQLAKACVYVYLLCLSPVVYATSGFI